MHVANRIWGSSGLEIHPEFAKTLKANYGVNIGRVDFSDAESSRSTINDWIDQQTDHRIPTLVDAGVINSDTQLLLTNAVYLKADWRHPFHRKQTRVEQFHVSLEQSFNVPMMKMKENFRYAETPNLKILEIPYARNSQLSMRILLPREIEQLSSIEDSLTYENLRQIDAALQLRMVQVEIPKFAMHSELRLIDDLQKMGMTLPFTENADFRGISSQRPLFITDIVHKTTIDVNEDGTEAVAGTGGMAGMGSDFFNEPTRFIANHPFIFLIMDNKTKCILFLGRLAFP